MSTRSSQERNVRNCLTDEGGPLGCAKKKEVLTSCCTRDEGRSLEAALQGEASNCHKLLRHNGHGGERCG